MSGGWGIRKTQSTTAGIRGAGRSPKPTVWVAYIIWKRQEQVLPQGLQKGHPDFNPVRSMSDF